MICRNCLRAASRTRVPSSTIRQSQRFLTTSSAFQNAAPVSATTATQTAPRQGNSTSSHTPPTATSTSAAQPFSEPLTPAASPDLKAQAAKVAEKKATPLVKSSIPAGQRLKGLNFLKNAEDPVALPDDEYPSWLWTILDRQEQKAEAGAGDLFSKSKKQRRLAAKRLRKEQAMNPELLAPKVPLYEQTIDLPAGDGSLQGAVKAADAREELTKAMRNKRRATIKEANFLKAMG
ncbi:Nn.00g057040.m01.CDS01 [Neocucurbitaria sp. VM-36]